jgi:hypothetical protein
MDFTFVYPIKIDLGIPDVYSLSKIMGKIVEVTGGKPIGAILKSFSGVK